MMLATLVWGAPDWAWPAAALAAVALTLVAWGYWAARGSPGTRSAAVVLKSLGIALLALCLVEPLLSNMRPRPGENQFAVLADTSQSLGVRDARGTQTRGERLADLLAEGSPWQTRLGQDFDVRRYTFDARLKPVESYAALTFDGASSSLAAALENLARRYRGRPLAGVLLLTDGNATDLAEVNFSALGLPPVYPVVLGDDAPGRDLSLTRVTVSQTSFEDAPVTVNAELTAAGLGGESLVVQLLDERGRVLEKQSLRASDDGQPLVARFQTRPESAGVGFYQVRALPESELAAADEPSRSREATLANNRRLLAVDRGAGPYRVLYVSGRPNWEFKFLRRALADDEQVQLLGLVRIARREPKFDFRGRAGESTNPLFRGFGNQGDEAAESYDKPVLVRLGTEDAAELRDGFPKTSEELFRYQAVIVDDLEAEFFTSDQLALLRTFVGQRGGGLLMLGGLESFAGGGYERTPLGEVLPVYLDRLPETAGGGPGHVWRLKLEREGWLQPWVRLRATEPDERQRLDAMPPLQVVNRVRGVKPGATVLAAVVDVDGTERPALVEQRFGKGRSLALAIGDLFHWGLRRGDDESAKSDLDKAWRQMVRWLVADVPERIEVAARHEHDDPSQPVRLVVQARTAAFEPLDNATVTVRVTSPDAATLELTASASDAEAGQYETTYVPRMAGAYRVEVAVVGPDGAEVGRRTSGWTSDPAADEFRVLRPNRELLTRLARETGGELIEAADLPSLVADLPNRTAPVTEPSITPLWQTPWLFLLAIACLCGEWGLRRWRGLP